MNPLSLLSGMWGYLAAAVIAAGLAVASTHYIDSAVYGKQIANLKLGAATAATAAATKSADEGKQIAADNYAAGLKDGNAQTVIQTVTKTIIQKVPQYVTQKQDAVGCVTFGFIRVLVSAERGVDPAALTFTAGESDGACAPYELSALAADLANDFGAANGNAQQLNDLEAAVMANATTVAGSK